MVAGPRRLGAVARAIITQTDPMICEKARVALTRRRESVCALGSVRDSRNDARIDL